jgi:hypothetical protein
MKPTDLRGIDDYMKGLIAFAQAVAPGSARVIASVGDEQNSLILPTVKATLGPSGASVTIPAARLAVVEDEKITAEQVVYFAIPD